MRLNTLTMTGCVENERVEAMAMSIEEQLSIAYPEGPSFFRLGDNDTDDKEGSEKENEASNFRSLLEDAIDDLAYPSDFDEFKKAMATVVHTWKTRNAQKDKNSTTAEGDTIAKTSGKSVSLFDQLQGGFPMPVSLEEIEEASSSEQRLKVLQKIEYLEDLVMDWNKIGSLLVKDLSELFFSNPALCLELVDMHRKWFHKGRSSSEYTPLLFGICENLLQTLAKTKSIDDTMGNHQIIIVESLVKNWRDMWLDLMQRDQYEEGLAGDMEQSMIELFLGPADCKVSLLAQGVLASVDSSATWFQSWTNHVPSNDHLVSFLTSDPKGLLELWDKIRLSRYKGERNSMSLLHPTAIISIVLCRTRLSQFPWYALTNSNLPEDDKISINNFRTVIDEMLEAFLHAVVFLSIDDGTDPDSTRSDLRLNFLDGIEAIVAGSRIDSEAEADRRRNKARSSLQEVNLATNSTVRHFLKKRLQQ